MNLQYVTLCDIIYLVLRPFPSEIIGFISFNGNSLKMEENAFYCILKALLVLQILKFLFRLFGHVGKRFDEKAKVNFKSCDVRI